jgi:hypothetical protein
VSSSHLPPRAHCLDALKEPVPNQAFSGLL